MNPIFVANGGAGVYRDVHELVFREYEKLSVFIMQEIEQRIIKPTDAEKQDTARDMVDELFGRFRLSTYNVFATVRPDYSTTDLLYMGDKKSEFMKRIVIGILEQCHETMFAIKAAVEALDQNVNHGSVVPFDKNEIDLSILRKPADHRLSLKEIRDVTPNIQRKKFDVAYRYYEAEVHARFKYNWNKLYKIVRAHVDPIVKPKGRGHVEPNWEEMWNSFMSAFKSAHTQV